MMQALPLTAVNEPAGIGAIARCALAAGGVAVFFTNLDSYAAAAWPAPSPTKLVVALAGATAALVLLDPHRPAVPQPTSGSRRSAESWSSFACITPVSCL